MQGNTLPFVVALTSFLSIYILSNKDVQYPEVMQQLFCETILPI